MMRRKKDIILLGLGVSAIFIPISFLTLVQGKILDNLIKSQEIHFFGFNFDGL
jgi:hypothetical protein